MKIAAVVLGPSGVGLIGIYQNLVATASTAASLGLGNSGTRQIAEANTADDEQRVATARRALNWGTLILAILGGAIFWVCREPLAVRVLGDARHAHEVGWMAGAVTFTVLGNSQIAVLTGLRKITDIARVRIWSGVVATVVGSVALWIWGFGGLVVFVLAAPVAGYVIAQYYVAQLPDPPAGRLHLPEVVSQWKTLVRLGGAFMVAGVMSTVGLLALRSLIQHDLGEAALGQFQAAWGISMTYVGFVLGAMGTDYYPRLTAAIHDHAATNRLVNEQTEVALLLAGPVLIAMLAWSPWVIRLLYSSDFAGAASVLRLQVLGDILKVATWPIGFVLMAANRGQAFMLTQTVSTLALVVLVWLGIPAFGIEATGVGFIGMYLTCLPIVYVQARISSGFRWSQSAMLQLVTLMVCGCTLCLLSTWSETATLLIGSFACIGLAINAILRITQMANLGGPIGRLAAKLRRRR